MTTKAKDRNGSQPSIKDAFGHPAGRPWNATANPTEQQSTSGTNDLDEKSNKKGDLTFQGLITMEGVESWSPTDTPDWQHWLLNYDGPTHPFTKAERQVEPGEFGFKTGRIVLTQMITQNTESHPSKLSDYRRLIREAWDEDFPLSDGL
jgi:hypothetical protein